MFIIDDLAPIGTTFGGPVELPSIQSIAERGVSFTNNYANIPVCGASRASMMSGLAPTSTRFLTFDSRLDEDAPEALSIPGFFRANGWHTAANGKIFDVIADSENSWSEPVWSPESQWHGKTPDHRGEHLQAAYIEPVSTSRFPYSERLPANDDDYPDGQVASKSIADLARLAQMENPFFLAVGFRKPHLPFNAPEHYWSDEESVNLPATWSQPGTDIPLDFAGHLSPELRRQYDALPFFGEPDTAQAKEIVAAYHAAARYADAQVGRVLDALEKSGQANNTIVILMGDHGFLLGQHKLWTKHSLFDSALRTPLIIKDPRLAQTATVTAVTDLLDVYPTLVDLAGLQTSRSPNGIALDGAVLDGAALDGQSLRALLEAPDDTITGHKKASIARWLNGESIRVNQYRYTRWFDKNNETLAEMLYDLTEDPDESRNLVSETSSFAQIEQLRQLLEQDRQGAVWSEPLDAGVAQWNLLASPVGRLLILSIVHPVATKVVAGSLLLMIVLLIWARLRSRRQR